MNGVTRLVGRFLLLFLITVAALVPLWGTLGPHYTAAVSALARPILHVAESPHVTVLAVQNDELWVYRRVGEQEIAPFTFFDRYAFFAVVPLVALLIATPGLRWRRRLAVVAVALAGQLAVHAGYVVASTELAYAELGLVPAASAAAGTLDVVQVIVRLLWEASPMLLWIALTLGAWKRAWVDLRTREPVRASAPQRNAHAGTKEQSVHLREGRTT